MLNNHFILDACTFINLLRIDEDNYFLSLLLGDLKDFFNNVHILRNRIPISEMVLSEIEDNKFVNGISEEKRTEINTFINNYLRLLVWKDKDIKDELGVFYDEIKLFSNHLDSNSKENGELLSTALALLISRKEQNYVTFFTDDYPAKEEFQEYFEFQQIGQIQNTIDLLIYWYWNAPDFSEEKLIDALKDIESEYSPRIKVFVEQLQQLVRQKGDKRFTKEKSVMSDLINSCSNYDYGSFQKNCSIIESKKSDYPTVYKLLKEYPDLFTQCKQIDEANKFLNYLQDRKRKYSIYKVE